jgi:A/G-specific adenine glycosylase
MVDVRIKAQEFHKPLLQWFSSMGRKDLPWQSELSAYRVWISEVMLQQTQVKTVIPYFQKFIQSFPSIEVLANAPLDDVLAHWSGLGYYSRARNLHSCARQVVDKHNGKFPTSLAELIKLPGLGRSTASAITSIAFNQATPILDGNVKRVLCRCFMIDGWPEQSSTNKRLWNLAEYLMPKKQCANYTQAIMDLGAMVCTRSNPLCIQCPIKNVCLASSNNCQSEYPHKKAKNPIPKKSAVFIIVSDENNQVLLHKRPPTGIWGGLWCLPQATTSKKLKALVQNEYGVIYSNPKSLIKFEHRFSHFELECTILHSKLDQLESRITEPELRTWASEKELAKLGLAKPISFALKTYFQEKIV